jgi:hypothetical protein
VIAVHATRHAVTLRADNGAEILMHVGLETVGLGGEGFEVHVEDGQAVKAGDKLISFDLDLLSQRAKSLITPVVITNPDAFQIVRREQDHAASVGDFLMELAPVGGAGATWRSPRARCRARWSCRCSTASTPAPPPASPRAPASSPPRWPWSPSTAGPAPRARSG